MDHQTDIDIDDGVGSDIYIDVDNGVGVDNDGDIVNDIGIDNDDDVDNVIVGDKIYMMTLNDDGVDYNTDWL